jgi:hypothetical protein
MSHLLPSRSNALSLHLPKVLFSDPFIQYKLRESLFAFYALSTTAVGLENEETAGMLLHGRHCIEYIRQALMCSPDLNFEPVELEPTRLRQWGIQRQCKDFNALSDWAREMRANDDEGI